MAGLDLLELVRLVRLPLPLPTIEVLLPPIHVLRQHFPVEVADGIEESLDAVPGLLIPGALLVDENLVVLVREEVELLVLVTYIKPIVGDIPLVELEGRILVDVVLCLHVVPGTNLRQVLLVQKQGHQEENV